MWSGHVRRLGAAQSNNNNLEKSVVATNPHLDSWLLEIDARGLKLLEE